MVALSFPTLLRACVATAFFFSGLVVVRAVDFTGGVTTAVPVKDGRAPVIDGDLVDWDLSAAEPVYIAEQTAERMNAEWAFMYDADAFYVSARVTMPGRPFTNPNNPQDSFWWSDLLQLRMSSDPALPYPLDPNRDKDSDRVAHLSFWQNSGTGVNYLHIVHGVKLDKTKLVNPPGSGTVIKTDGDRGYVVESRIPWSALNAPGGKNPFKPGQRGAFVMEALWIGGDPTRVAAGYAQNPGTFAFMSAPKWGQLEFAAASPGQRRRPTLAGLIADIKAARGRTSSNIGVPFELTVPADGLKASVNILGPKGEVLRELLGAAPVDKGVLALRWDGRDAWGKALPPGEYRWGAYLHKGLQADYAGSVGVSGQTAYNTQDGKGGWGGDHSNPIGAASDAAGLYFLWPVAEAGKALVKTDYEGTVLWRVTPFVGGGFGPFYGVASDGTYVYLTRGDGEKGVYLARLDAKTGALLTWGEGGPSELMIHKTSPALVAEESSPAAGHLKGAPAGQVYAPDSTGFAIHDGRGYVTSFAGNKVHVVSTATGQVTGSFEVPGPRGLTVDERGRIFVACFASGKGAVLRFDSAESRPVRVVTNGLDAPYGIAVDAAGRLYVSDLGASQQLKIFSEAGALVRALGKKGGRAWQGAYDGGSFLRPAGLAVDARGGLLVAEASPPRVFSRLSTEDGSVLGRWYGAGVYFNSTWPMPDDPKHVFYMLGEAVGRGRVAGPGSVGVPDAYWNPAKAGYPHVGDIESGIPHPELVKAGNGRLYFVRDARERTIYVFEPDETLRPVAFWKRIVKSDTSNPVGKDHLHVWIDADGDGQIQPGEETRLTQMPDGKPLPETANATASMHMTAEGDLYFMSHRNCIFTVPAAGFGPKGVIKWDLAKLSLAVTEVLPGAKELSTTWRHGILGVRIDSQRNLYTLFNARVEGKGGAFDYPDAATAAALREGMGHTASFNAVKFAKFSPDGKLLWMAGRKAVAGEQPGEMYHFWNMAGLVNDRYIAGGSEWGRIYLYTHDGFYVDALMNNPGDAPLPGPYTFGGETSGGRVQYFPATGELWAYSTGGAYRVKGFSKGAVEGEQRLSGTVRLDKSYALPVQAAAAAPASPVQVVPLNGQGLAESSAWSKVPVSVLTQRGGGELARAQFGYDAQFLYGRIEVTDDTPLQNEATEATLAFKGGDTAGVVLGAGPKGDRPVAGDIRLMVASIRGQPRLIAMKAVTRGAKQPFEYTTPASGTVAFEFVGEVPGGRVVAVRTASGYVATFAVPRGFLEFELKPGATLRGDVEVRLSGAGQRGIQTTSRNYLFTPSRAETGMVDDIPTESRLYPVYWGAVEVK